VHIDFSPQGLPALPGRRRFREQKGNACNAAPGLSAGRGDAYARPQALQKGELPTLIAYKGKLLFLVGLGQLGEQPTICLKCDVCVLVLRYFPVQRWRLPPGSLPRPCQGGQRQGRAMKKPALWRAWHD